MEKVWEMRHEPFAEENAPAEVPSETKSPEPNVIDRTSSGCDCEPSKPDYAAWNENDPN